MQAKTSLAIAAAIVIAAGACGLPTPEPSAIPTRSAAVVAATSTTSPSLSRPGSVFAQRSFDPWPRLPFPEPLRTEPGGDPTIVPGTTWEDPSGDGRPDHVDLVDVVSLEIDAPCYSQAMCVEFDIGAQDEYSLSDPNTELVAFGLVLDDDGDGVGDRRVGVDHAWPGDRIWTIDLDGSATVAYAALDGKVDAWIPSFAGPPWPPEPLGGRIEVDELPGEAPKFYFWATVIRDDKVASTDFAPDVGWLAARPQE
jgi:hypothetical protein